MMNVTPHGGHGGFRVELPDGHYEYITLREATRLFDNLRDALRPEPHPLSTAIRAPYQPVAPSTWAAGANDMMVVADRPNQWGTGL